MRRQLEAAESERNDARRSCAEDIEAIRRQLEGTQRELEAVEAERDDHNGQIEALQRQLLALEVERDEGGE